MAKFEFNFKDSLSPAIRKLGEDLSWKNLLENEPSALERMKAQMSRWQMENPWSLAVLDSAHKTTIRRLLNTHKIENIEMAAQLLVGLGVVADAEDEFVTLWINSMTIRTTYTRDHVQGFYFAAAAVKRVSLADACRNPSNEDELINWKHGPLWLEKYIAAIWANVPQE